MAVVLAIGTIGFRAALDESWLQSFYRAVVSSSLTGLDTVPRTDSARILTIFLVLAGISIFAYIGSLVVEAIARGVIGGLWAERRRRKAIQALRDHYIICGFCRVGGERPLPGGQRHRRRGPPQRRPRTRARADRGVGRRRRQPLHHAVRARREPEPPDRRPRVERGRLEEASARRGGSHRAALPGRRAGDGEPDAAPAGHGVRRRRDERVRERPAFRGDRSDGSVRAGWEVDPGPRRPQGDGCADRGAAQARRNLRHDADTRG